MLSLRTLLCHFSLADCASNDNAGRNAAAEPGCASHRPEPADPYLAEAREARQLIAGARLISSVDGNPAALLNLMATREPRSRRAA